MEQFVKLAVERRTVTYFAAFLLLAGGIASYFKLGKLEDPNFTVKTAIILTTYPGASPGEVEEEVSDVIEGTLQEMPQLRFLTSYSRAGSSLIKVEIKQEYWADRLPQVWDEMRKKIRDASGELPPGAGNPIIMDDFSFVYGFVLAVTGDGFSYGELDDYAKFIRKELNLVPGVSRVEVWGQQPKVIYIDASETQLAELGLTTEVLLANLTTQNVVVDAGGVEIQDQRFRFEVTGDFSSVEQIENLPIRANILDAALGATSALGPGALPELSRGTSLIRVKDVATVRRGYLEPPMTQMRFQKKPALAVSVANVKGGNILDTGAGLEAALANIKTQLPVGIEIDRIAWQSDLVDESIGAFMINLLEAVVIVLVVVAIAMGMRMGIIIGAALMLTILGTFIVMAIMGIDLQRVSLGALVIALGMMVDNAIVVADNTSVAIKRGMDRTKAAIQSAAKPSISLLGATFVAVLAFYPIFAAKADTGEYASSLFTVVGISLLFSWVISMTVTPLMCINMLPEPKKEAGSEGEKDEYDSAFFRIYRNILEGAIRLRVLTVAGVIGLFFLSIYGFKYVDRVFFTDATRTQFMIDYWAPEGTRIQQVGTDLVPIEARLQEDERVLNVSTFIGSGPPRFYLPVDPEFSYQSYAQIIVNTVDLDSVTPLVEEMQSWVDESQPQALVRVRKFTAGPGFTWPLEARFSGPSTADREVLKSLAAKGVEILRSSPHAKDVRTDMRQPVRKVVTEYDDARARWVVVSRVNVAQSLRGAYDGLPVGLYREGDDVQPIMVRFVEEERQRLSENLRTLQVRPALATKSVPLDSVVSGINLEWEDPILVRWNRRPAVTVQCSPNNVTFPALFEEVREAFESIDLPPGYQLEWRGEQFGTVDSQESLVPGVIPSIVIMVFIAVALFNAFRPPIIIFLVLPLGLIGITGGLLLTSQPFSFMALLGAMSLVGMMIKNAIVLLDEIGANRKAGKKPYDSVIEAGLSRIRPVTLGAVTTVLGVAPLIQDIFWVAMAVTIMAGLTFGTIVTLVVVPVVYTILFRIPASKN
jgi:multidrug efflux pump subunit AcrB